MQVAFAFSFEESILFCGPNKSLWREEITTSKIESVYWCLTHLGTGLECQWAQALLVISLPELPTYRAAVGKGPAPAVLGLLSCSGATADPPGDVHLFSKIMAIMVTSLLYF